MPLQGAANHEDANGRTVVSVRAPDMYRIVASSTVGDHILTQQDLMGLNGDFPDAVAIGGWGLDEHPPGGFDATERPPFVSTKLADVYNIPLRSLYSKDLANLFMEAVATPA